MAKDKQQLGGTICEDSPAPVVIAVSEWKGETRLDIRHYWTPEGEHKTVPTKKGVSIPLEELDDLINILLGIQAEVNK